MTWKDSTQFPLRAIIAEKRVQYHVRRSELLCRLRDFPNCLCLVHSWCLGQCFYFYCATKVPFIYKYEKERYCYAHRVLCCIAEPSLCHKQCDRLRRRKLNPPSPPFSPLLVLCHVCLSFSFQTFTLLGRLSDV